MTESRHRTQGLATQAPPEYSGKILIVDDELFIRNALQLYLETLGFTVLVAESGERAIEIFAEEENRLDVVILDLVMPGIQGIEVLKILKEKDASVEVIIATGCGSMGSAIEALRYGAFDYITKPIVNFDQDLLKVLEEAIENRQKSRRSDGTHGSAASNLYEKRLLVFEELAALAAMANLRRREEPTLEQVEDLLFRDFGARAGVVLSLPPPPREAVPVYSWGLPGSLSQRQVKWGETDVLRSLRNGCPGLFPLERLSDGLGLSHAALSGFSELAGLPLSLAGDPYGGLLLFFAEKLPPHLGGSLERHPFQLLSPLLARIFASSLRHTLSQASM